MFPLPLPRSLFDAPQGVTPKTFFVPTLSANRRAQDPSRSRAARPALPGRLDGSEHGGTPRASGRIARNLARAVLKLVQRVFIAEAVLWLTALACALAGFPAVVTAFFVALVGLLVNLWLAVRTLAPIGRRLFRGRY